MTDLIDTRLGQYHLTEVIGRGGMATVYKAYQPTLDRFVAVKVLSHDRDPQFTARFEREARAIARLQHPNILPVYDYGKQDDLLYLVLQYIETGATLSDMLGAPMAPATALRLATHLLAALDYAHTRGVIHRDIKPSNILMLSSRWPMLADFGIAKLMSDTQSKNLTRTGLIIGTAAYMAPEQAAGRPIDVRTDLYAAGIVLYELLTGRVPFDADTPVAVLMKQAYEPPPPPRSLKPDIPAAAEAALLRALEKEPDARYQSAAAMAEELERVAIQIERGSARDQLAGLYQAGAQAFRAGRWDAAIEQLGQLVALDATYEDAQTLLDQARTARAYSQQEAARRASDPTVRIEREPLPGSVAVVRCPRCGKEVRPEWTGCPYCRAPLSEAAGEHEEKVAPTPRPRRIDWRLWTTLLIVLALLGGGALIVRGTAAPPTPTPIPTAIPTAAIAQLPGKLLADSPTTTDTAVPTATATPTSSATPTLAPSPDALVNIAQLNLRSGPDTRFPSLGLYNRGVTLRVIGKAPTGAWLQVQAPDNHTGWMSAAGLQVNISLTDVPVVAASPIPTPLPTRTPRPTRTPTPPQPTDTPVPPPGDTPTPPPTDTPTPTHKPDHDRGCGGNCPPPPP